MEHQDIVTKQNLVTAYNDAILVKITESINRSMDRLCKNPLLLNEKCNQIFLSDIHPYSLSETLQQSVRKILTETFGFEEEDIIKIDLSSDEIPCLLIQFKL